MPSLRKGADRQHELELRQAIEQGSMPKLAAHSRSRREIAAIFILPGKAKAHGNDGDAGLVVDTPPDSPPSNRASGRRKDR